jgi:hypothetical protein
MTSDLGKLIHTLRVVEVAQLLLRIERRDEVRNEKKKKSKKRRIK